MSPSDRILFLCTANYYRSRFAELYCNHLAELRGLAVRSDSAGLEMTQWRHVNPGELSGHAERALKDLGIPIEQPPRAPKQFASSMITDGVRAIALSEREHRPMIARDFPELVGRIEFWSVEDVDLEVPDRALRRIRESVESCLEAYHREGGPNHRDGK